MVVAVVLIGNFLGTMKYYKPFPVVLPEGRYRKIQYLWRLSKSRLQCNARVSKIKISLQCVKGAGFRIMPLVW